MRHPAVPVRALLPADPAAGTSTLAGVQGWPLAIIFPLGVALVVLEGPSFELAPIDGRRHGAVHRGSIPDFARLAQSWIPLSPPPSHLLPYPWHSQGNRFASLLAHAKYEILWPKH
jgi:hypothetical protein